jgi:hypothetical protein
MLGGTSLGAGEEEETQSHRVLGPALEEASPPKDRKERPSSPSAAISGETPYLVLEPLPLLQGFPVGSLSMSAGASAADNSPSPYVCEWTECSETFGTQRDLVLHSNDHIASLNWAAKTNRESLLICRWRDCWNPHPFSYQMRMVEHMRAHTLEKPYMVRLLSFRWK